MASWDNAPVWAKSMVKDWRVKASIPDTVTDDEMYAALAYMSISGIGGPDTDAEIEVLRGHLDLGQRPTPVYFPECDIQIAVSTRRGRRHPANGRNGTEQGNDSPAGSYREKAHGTTKLG